MVLSFQPIVFAYFHMKFRQIFSNVDMVRAIDVDKSSVECVIDTYQNRQV